MPMINGPGERDATPWRPGCGPDRHGWELSPYPDGRDFAFTIVHDADSAYSRRLAPLFETFDALGMALTVTVFPFWAAWAHGGDIWRKWRAASLEERALRPVAVPLEDPEERAFYLELAARGHEIAIHTPSETSSERSEVVRAFACFAEVFGRRARMYVEHSGSSKLDALIQQGADPDSRYYNLDLLRDSGCWVWLDQRSALTDQDGPYHDALSLPGGPWNRAAQHDYALQRAFVRNGAANKGDRFLANYRPEVMDDLARRRGLVLLYTHLNYGWLDPRTFAMDGRIREGLEHMTSLNGWFASGSDILDRFEAMAGVRWWSDEHRVTLANGGERAIEGLTLLTDEPRATPLPSRLRRGAEPHVLILDRLDAGESLALDFGSPL